MRHRPKTRTSLRERPGQEGGNPPQAWQQWRGNADNIRTIRDLFSAPPLRRNARPKFPQAPDTSYSRGPATNQKRADEDMLGKRLPTHRHMGRLNDSKQTIGNLEARDVQHRREECQHRGSISQGESIMGQRRRCVDWLANQGSKHKHMGRLVDRGAENEVELFACKTWNCFYFITETKNGTSCCFYHRS